MLGRVGQDQEDRIGSRRIARRRERARTRAGRRRGALASRVVDEHREPLAGRLSTIPRAERAPAPRTPQRITRASASRQPGCELARALPGEDEGAEAVDRELELGEDDDRRVRELDHRRARDRDAGAEREAS